MKWLLGLAAAASLGGQALAQDIDPLHLPAEGLERTYACRSYLSAFAAIAKALDPKDEAGSALVGLFMVMHGEADSGARAGGVDPDVAEQRMRAWDDAVLTAVLDNLKSKETELRGNLGTCVRAAAERGASRQ